MRWHPATGTGAIVLANGTYAAAGALAGELLAAVLAELGPPPAGAAGCAARSRWPTAARPRGRGRRLLAAQDAVNGLLQEWDDEVAERLFTANVALDRPLAQRRADIARLRERIGEFRPDPDRPAESDSPAHSRWWLTGPHGRATAAIKLAPLAEPRVQQLVLAVPPAPDSALGRALAAVVATINAGALQWPAGLTVADGAASALRQLRLAAAWAGQCQPGGCLAGDGSSTATVELTGPTGQATLTVEVSGPGPELQRAEVTLLS